jgi:hypothetical protein
MAYSPISGDKWTDEAERKWRLRLRNHGRQAEAVDGEIFGLMPCELRALFENIVEEERGQKGKNQGKIEGQAASEIRAKGVGGLGVGCARR